LAGRGPHECGHYELLWQYLILLRRIAKGGSSRKQATPCLDLIEVVTGWKLRRPRKLANLFALRDILSYDQ